MKKLALILLGCAVVFFGYTYWVRQDTGTANLPSLSDEMIEVTAPKAGEKISSPLRVTGRARGTWFFEGSFPVMLVDWDGRIIAQGIAAAQGEWMTEEFVPFSGVLEFEKPKLYPERGALILKKDNLSGLPEYDAAVEIPIQYE